MSGKLIIFSFSRKRWILFLLTLFRKDYMWIVIDFIYSFFVLLAIQINIVKIAFFCVAKGYFFLKKAHLSFKKIGRMVALLAIDAYFRDTAIKSWQLQQNHYEGQISRTNTWASHEGVKLRSGVSKKNQLNKKSK